MTMMARHDRVVLVIQKAFSKCLWYKDLSSVFNGCHSNDQSFLFNCVLGIYGVYVLCGLSTEGIGCLTLQKVYASRCCTLL